MLILGSSSSNHCSLQFAVCSLLLAGSSSRSRGHSRIFSLLSVARSQQCPIQSLALHVPPARHSGPRIALKAGLGMQIVRPLASHKASWLLANLVSWRSATAVGTIAVDGL